MKNKLLGAAIDNENFEDASNIIKLGADVDYMLRVAINSEKPFKVIAFLCQHGANIAHKNVEGKSPVDIALEWRQFKLVQVMLEHSKLVLIRNNKQQLERSLARGDDLYLFKYLLDKTANNHTYSIFGLPKPYLLSWSQFKYILERFNRTPRDKENIFSVIEKHVFFINTDAETKELITAHAKACCNYLRETRGIAHGYHQSNLSKIFLKRILCETITTKDGIEREALNYIRGDGIYSSLIRLTQGSGYSKHSRIAYAYDLGLFRRATPRSYIEPFSTLSEEVRKVITLQVKQYGFC
jgi:hypothetical protein